MTMIALCVLSAISMHVTRQRDFNSVYCKMLPVTLSCIAWLISCPWIGNGTEGSGRGQFNVYYSTLLKILRTTTKRLAQCLKLDSKKEKQEFISLRSCKFLSNTRARTVNMMYTPDLASFHSRTSIPMMMMMTMMVVLMMMMMMIKNNNSWRKPANEIISNDSASFLLVML